MEIYIKAHEKLYAGNVDAAMKCAQVNFCWIYELCEALGPKRNNASIRLSVSLCFNVRVCACTYMHFWKSNLQDFAGDTYLCRICQNPHKTHTHCLTLSLSETSWLYFFLSLSPSLPFCHCVRLCIHQALAAYDDILDPVDVYSLIALTGFHNQMYGVCSDAFMRLEQLPEIDQVRPMNWKLCHLQWEILFLFVHFRAAWGDLSLTLTRRIDWDCTGSEFSEMCTFPNLLKDCMTLSKLGWCILNTRKG